MTTDKEEEEERGKEEGGNSFRMSFPALSLDMGVDLLLLLPLRPASLGLWEGISFSSFISGKREKKKKAIPKRKRGNILAKH